MNKELAPLGALHQERRISIIVNNLSNAQTAGFKKDVPVFQNIFFHEQERLRNQKMEATRTDFSQGDLRRTGNDLDLAITGEGFFKISTPNGIRYSRAGDFRLDQQGRLVNAAGLAVQSENGEIILDGKKKITVGTNGTVQALGAENNSQPETVGKIALVRFADLSALKKEGHTLFRNDGVQDELEAPEAELQQGLLETSNVNAVAEMAEMMEAYRTFETCMKIIQSDDELTGKTVNEVGRV
ncbi:MAG: flagellar basal-body rod protein FlgF [Deltaproteobacteria bacterium]|nr:flagellar basal-body rod protein FlgF [Deltaproteobacteria bacterium]